MITVSGFSQSAAASRAAASGRHKNATSAWLMQSARAAGSPALRVNPDQGSSGLSFSRSNIFRPVVPSCPSTKIFAIFLSLFQGFTGY